MLSFVYVMLLVTVTYCAELCECYSGGNIDIFAALCVCYGGGNSDIFC